MNRLKIVLAVTMGTVLGALLLLGFVLQVSENILGSRGPTELGVAFILIFGGAIGGAYSWHLADEAGW